LYTCQQNLGEKRNIANVMNVFNVNAQKNYLNLETISVETDLISVNCLYERLGLKNDIDRLIESKTTEHGLRLIPEVGHTKSAALSLRNT
jgi:hypothetical protein